MYNIVEVVELCAYCVFESHNFLNLLMMKKNQKTAHTATGCAMDSYIF